MKKIFLSSMALVLAACTLSACGGGTEAQSESQQTEAQTQAQTEAQTDAQTEPEITDTSLPKDKEYSVLFIGNSFTYCSDMPSALFAPLCAAAGYNVKVDSVTRGGYYLHQFANQNDEYGKKVLEKLKNNTYDYVVIQEQSGNAVYNPKSFFAGVRSIARLVERYNDGQLVLFETWGYKTGYHLLPTHGGSTEMMEIKMRAAYTAIGEELGCKVALVGVAFMDIFTNEKSIELYDKDLSHPSKSGSLLAAYTIFSTIFESDVRGVTFDTGVRRSEIKPLQQAAYTAVFEEHPVPKRHRIDSTDM